MMPAGKTVPPCAWGCFNIIDRRERQWLLKTFNDLADTSMQNIYLLGFIQTDPAEEWRRDVSYHYFVQRWTKAEKRYV